MRCDSVVLGVTGRGPKQSTSPHGNVNETTSCLSAPTPSSPKIQRCEIISWIRATDSSRKLALTTSFGVSDVGLTTRLHANRTYGAVQICWARLCKPCDASSANSRHHRRATNYCLLRASRPPVETTSSKLILLRDSDCVQATRLQPPLRRVISTLHTCHRTTAATSLL